MPKTNDYDILCRFKLEKDFSRLSVKASSNHIILKSTELSLAGSRREMEQENSERFQQWEGFDTWILTLS